MKHVCKIAKPYLLVLLLATAVVGLAWQPAGPDAPKKGHADQRSAIDTTRPHKPLRSEDDYRVGDLDKVLQNLEAGLENLKVQMKEIQFDKINRQVRESIEKIDFDKISRDATVAMSRVDWKKMNEEVRLSMKDAQAELAKIDMAEIKKQVEGLKEKMENGEMKITMDSVTLNKTIRESIGRARLGMGKAREELNHLKTFIDVLHNDGLIDKKKAYKVELRDGDLYINDRIQPKETTEKYKQYYWKEHFMITSQGRDSLYL